eukprot:gb/GECG01006866.1/.p1 GENE.gb/GECG01006866.1/~~gb/GECG01006866.1/.p1  ORF type:complete len:294 (+),score=27.19 gb/GECG01006866.1/:1-882(+)
MKDSHDWRSKAKCSLPMADTNGQDTTIQRQEHGTRSDAAPCMYVGRVAHHRRKPKSHRFEYGLFYMFLNTKRLNKDIGNKWWPLLGIQRPAIAAFYDRDHMKGRKVSSESTDSAVRKLVHEKTGKFPEGDIFLLTHLRYCGYCFNPVSFYYVYKPGGDALESVVAEVSNTPWGEMHWYVMSDENPEVEAKDIELRCDGVTTPATQYKFRKAFHVSPFMDMNHQYRWTLTAPKEKLFIYNTNTHDEEGTLFSASLEMTRWEICSSNIIWILVSCSPKRFKGWRQIHPRPLFESH